MALPIKETPILKGSDAVRFIVSTNNPKPASKQKYDKAKSIYDKLTKPVNNQPDAR